ncbi:hypothetical protein [Acetoanaerobium noterae]|uniref:hypothetical protein n=1 Tax=Acetoanaerobium noterae TaxID=745369 RepID=UPI00331B91C8
MKYNKRMMKSRPDYDLFRNDTEEKYEINWKKIFFGWVIVDVIASATLLTLFFKKRNEKPIDKYKKDLSKSYKKSKKKFSKKADKILKNLENTAEDVYEKAYDHVDNTTAKTKSFKDTTLEKTKHTLSEIADSLEQISNKLRKQD